MLLREFFILALQVGIKDRNVTSWSWNLLSEPVLLDVLTDLGIDSCSGFVA